MTWLPLWIIALCILLVIALPISAVEWACRRVMRLRTGRVR